MAYLRFLFVFHSVFILVIADSYGQKNAQIPDSLRAPATIDAAYCERLIAFSEENTFAMPEVTLVASERVVFLGDSLGDLQLKNRGQYGAARSHTVMNHSEAALAWLDSVSVYSLRIPDSGMYFRGRVLTAVNYDHIGHFKRSLEEYRKALAFFRREENSLQIAMISNNVGGIYMQQGRLELALEHFLECMEVGKKVGKNRLVMASTINVSHAYLIMDSLDKAEPLLMNAYRSNYDNESWFGHGSLCDKLGELKTRQGQMGKAEAFIKEGMKISREIGDDLSISKIYFTYGEFYEKKGEFDLANAAYDSSRAVAVMIQAPDQEMVALKGLYQLQDSMGNLEEAYLAYKKYNLLRDSIYGEEKTQQLEELSATHNLERRQQEIQQLTFEKDFQKKLLQQQNWFIAGLIGVLVVTLLLLVLVYRSERRRLAVNRSLKDRNQKIAEQQEEILAKNGTLAHQNVHLETLNSEMEGLIEIVAHDLKSPIIKAQALVGLMEQEDLSENSEVQISMVKKVLETGMDLIKSILTLGSIESKDRSKPPEDVDLTQLVEDIANSFSGKAKQKAIDLHLEKPEEIVTTSSYRVELERILENLISNALKFSSPGTKVDLSLAHREKSIEIAVQDQGPGISADEQKIMFRKFQRLSARPTAGESSSGLGLSIVESLVKQLGGAIEVESQLGKGARFTVVLPK